MWPSAAATANGSSRRWATSWPASATNRPLATAPAEEPATAAGGDSSAGPGKPERLVRTCVARRNNSRAFGPLVAGAAQTRAFDDAPRRACLGDGAHDNWRLPRTWFPTFVAIADFLH